MFGNDSVTLHCWGCNEEYEARISAAKNEGLSDGDTAYCSISCRELSDSTFPVVLRK